jgi:hypothetical protein
MPAFAGMTWRVRGVTTLDTERSRQMRLLALAAGLLVAATMVPCDADASPVRAAAAGTTTAVVVTGRTAARGTVVVGKTAAKGTVVVGRTAARGTVAVARTTGRGVVCVATFFRRCARPYP